MVTDLVCGMTVDPATAKHRTKHAGKTEFFCSAGCKAKFEADPDKFLSPSAAEPEPMPEGTIFTCPMHPKIRQDGPGLCPICGIRRTLQTAFVYNAVGVPIAADVL